MKTEPDLTPVSGYDVSDGPRRLLLADLVASLESTVTRRARSYEVAAAQAQAALRHALEDLARSKHVQAADLAPLARALAVPAPSLPSPLPSAAPPAWGVILGEAFQAERTLEETARELAGLTSDPAVRALAVRQVARAGKDGTEVRRLYLRYT